MSENSDFSPNAFKIRCTWDGAEKAWSLWNLTKVLSTSIVVMGPTISRINYSDLKSYFPTVMYTLLVFLEKGVKTLNMLHVWGKESSKKTCSLLVLFSIKIKINTLWLPCLSHLPLRLGLLLSSFTHLLCLRCLFLTILSIFSVFLSVFSSLFNEQLLTFKSLLLIFLAG